MRRLSSCLLALVVSGCPRGSPAGIDAGPDGGDAVMGDIVDHWLLPSGVEHLPHRLGTRSITAKVEQADGTFITFPGVGFDDGTFRIPELPDGPYLLQVGSTFLVAGARRIHLGANRLGRPDSYIAGPGEGVELTVSDLAPWTADDELQLISWSTGQGYFSTAQRRFVRGAPDAGDAALSGALIDLEGASVIEASRGDDFTIVQLSGARDAGVFSRVATRSLRPSITMTVGVPTPVGGAMTTLPLTRAQFTVRAGEFTRHAAAVSVSAQPFVARLLIEAHPGSFGVTTHTGATPDLAIIEFSPDAGDARVDVSYGNPFSPPWRPFVSAGALFDVLYQVQLPDGGMTLPRSELGFVTTVLEPGEAAARPVEPLVSPVRSVTIDGRAASVPLTEVGLTPEVAWQPPMVGMVSRVEIEVVALSPAQSGGTKREAGDLLRVLSGHTRARLPPGFLNPASTYYLRVTALSLPREYDPASPLVDVGPPVGAASVLTAAFRTSSR